MIQQKKNPLAPDSLTRTKSHSEEDVKKQLVEDQHGKCYICESLTYQNGEVEHLKDKDTYPELRQSWENLFWACGHCNKKKQAPHSVIPSPLHEDYAKAIYVKPVFTRGFILFEIKINPAAHQMTVDLLNRIHNGHPSKFRKMNDALFYRRYREAISLFIDNMEKYRQTPSEENKKTITDALKEDQEFLATKYWLIQDSTPSIRDVFEPYTNGY